MENQKRKIILMDDVNFFLMSTKTRLEKEYEVYTVQNSETLYEVLTHVKPDLIMLDINMPEEDGFEIITKLKENKDYSDIPVFFLTSRDDKQSIIKGMELGASDFIIKPFTDKKLQDRIAALFNPKLDETGRPVILAIDDSPSILQAVNYALGDEYVVRTLNAPENLVPLLMKITPDLFLLDYQMPMITGFDCVKIIRSYPEHEETPIIIVTSERSIDHITTAMHLGCVDYIVKPFDNSTLRDKINTQMKNFKIRRRIQAITERENIS